MSYLPAGTHINMMTPGCTVMVKTRDNESEVYGVIVDPDDLDPTLDVEPHQRFVMFPSLGAGGRIYVGRIHVVDEEMGT